MKKTILLIAIIASGFLMQAQSHTYDNNSGAIFQKGETSEFTEFPMRWTVSNAGSGIYNINYSICLCDQCAVEVKYSHFNESNNMHIYAPIGSQIFEGKTVKEIMSSGKLSDYAKGNAPEDKNVLGIFFTDEKGIIYTLSNSEDFELASSE